MTDSVETKMENLQVNEEKTQNVADVAPTATESAKPQEWADDYGEENVPDVTIQGKTYKSLADGEYDAIIMSTGLKECVLAGLLAVRGLRVLQIDRNPYYGGACSSLNLEELYKHFNKDYDAEAIKQRFGNPRRFCVDLVPKLLMANGKLIKMLLQTGVTRYIDFNGVDGSYVLNSGKIYKVPVTPAEALKTSLVGFFQKRNLKNFAEFVGKWKAPDRTMEDRANATTDAEFKQIVEEYYKVHNPEKLADVDAVIAQFQGSKPKLVDALEQSYGVPVFPQEETVSFGPGPLGLRIESSPSGQANGPIKTLVRVIGFGTLQDGSKGEAEKSGKIAAGDIISKINGDSFLGKTEKDVLQVIQTAPRPIEFTFMKKCVVNPPVAPENDFTKVTMRDVYKRFSLDENSQNFIGHAMALQTDDTYMDKPAEDILKAVQLYGRSMGLYGQDSPYLYPMYGLSSLPEGFSRLAAIYGGTVMLRTDVDEIITDEQGRAVGVRAGERAASAKYIIGDASFFPKEKSRPTERIVRSICILRKPLPKTNGESAQIILPSKHINGKSKDVYISEIGPAHQVSPKGVYVAIASTTVETANPIGELEAAFKLMGPIEERFDSVVQMVSPVENGKNDNCFITSTLDATSHFETAAHDIMHIYYNIFGKSLDLNEKLVEDPNQ